MLRYYRCLALLAPLIVLASLPAAAHPTTSAGTRRLFMPMVSGLPLPLSPFGFDLRSHSGPAALGYAQQAIPRWTRAGDVVWTSIEPVRGGGYRWGVLAQVEANIKRLRAVGIEPTLVVQTTPGWAQRIPGRRCSPMKPEYIADFARFMRALAARYSSGDLAVHYWEFWNEPDYGPDEVADEQGVGCWKDASLPYHGGAYYGQVLKQIYPAVKAGNPRAQVFAGALLYTWPDDHVSRSFLSGILTTTAGKSFDALSFHAYGEWGAGDLLINKTIRIRELLASHGIPNKPLIATEIAATCYSNTHCPPNFIQRQANYAARIYAEAIALNLMGAFWYTLVSDRPGFAFSQLIDEVDGKLVPRPAYYAFRNSALPLRGARYIGPPLREPPPDQVDDVQVLPFQKTGSVLYVLWVPRIDFPRLYQLRVRPGARAICTEHLSDPAPAIYDCSDTNRDGFIPRAVNELPMYVEVFD